MSDNRKLENDAILIRKNQIPTNGDIVAALVGNDIKIRTYEKLTEDSFLLKAADVSGRESIRVKNNLAGDKKLKCWVLRDLLLCISTERRYVY